MNTLSALNRREFVQTAATAALAGFGGVRAAAAPRSKAPAGTGRHPVWVDVNVTLGRWPFRRLPFDETPALVGKLRQQGVTAAWAGTFDGVFHHDLAAANARLAEDCRRQGRGWLRPFGSVNPKLPGWKRDLQQCAEVHRMAGIRLHPTYHGYGLDDAAFAQLLVLAGRHRLIVQIVADLEDERTQHPLARVPHANLQPLVPLLRAGTGARVVVLNWARSASLPLAKQLAEAGACLDIATVENVGGVDNLVRQLSVNRVVFGSHAPLFYFESAALKLQESALTAETSWAIRAGNAMRLLSPV